MKYVPLISAVLRFVILHAHAINWEELGNFTVPQCFLVRVQVGLLSWKSFVRIFPPRGVLRQHLSGAGLPWLGALPLFVIHMDSIIKGSIAYAVFPNCARLEIHG